MGFLGDFFNGVSSIFSPASAVYGTLEANRSQERIANQNIAYQREMNNTLMEREDNAVQRRALDLQKAGLSKTLAAGSPASASPLTAPKNEYVPESVAKVLSKFNILDKINESRNLQAIADKNSAEVKKIESETTKNNITNGTLSDTISLENEKTKTMNELIKNQVNLVSSQIKLSNIEGEYRANKLSAEINSILANTKLTEENVKLKAEEIASELVKRFHLEKSTEKILSDIVIQEYNLQYSQYYGTPYGQQVTGVVGSVMSGVNSFTTQLGNAIKSVFGGK